jgi:hypothetical protein
MNQSTNQVPVNGLREPVALGAFTVLNASAMIFISAGLCFFGMQAQWPTSWKFAMSAIASISVLLAMIFAINTASSYSKSVGDPDQGSKLLGFGVLLSLLAGFVCVLCTGILFYRFVIEKTV